MYWNVFPTSISHGGGDASRAGDGGAYMDSAPLTQGLARNSNAAFTL